MLMCWISVTANVVSWLYTLLQTTDTLQLYISLSSEEAVFMFWLGSAQKHVIRLKEKIT